MKKLLTVFVMLLLPIVASAQIDPCLGIDSNGLIFDANHNGFVATLGEPFDAPKLHNEYNVSPILWTSSNPAVATVDDNGNVTLVSVGRTHIAATFAGNDQYKAAKAEYDLVVEGSDTDSASKADPSLSINSNGQRFESDRGFIATLGEPFNSLELSNPYDVSPIIWSSSNTEVATVDENGNVTIVGVGKTRIVATFAGNDEYKAGQVGYDLVVEGNDSDSEPDNTPDTDPATKIDPCLSINSNGQIFDQSRGGYVATLGEPFKSLEIGNPYNVSPIVWSSSNPAVATVDGNGIVTIVGVGETQIVGTFAGNDKYKPSEVGYSLVVEGSDSDTNNGSDPDTTPDADTNESGSATYRITSEGTVAISHNDQSGDVIIDETAEIDGKTYQVTAIAPNAFKDNLAITSVTMPNGLTDIGDNAFYRCINLLQVILGKDVKRIGERAFANIGTASAARTRGEKSNLTFTCYAEDLPQTDNTAFEATDIAHATLRVPGYLVEDYKETSPWSRFGTIEPIPGTETVSKTIHLEDAGMLPQYISEEEKYTINELILSGKVNGTDLRLIREMAGSDVNAYPTEGKLEKLDMTDVSIIFGGEPYLYPGLFHIDENSYTSIGTPMYPCESKTNVLGDCLFACCNKLKEIKLPRTITTIEDYAFFYAGRLKSLVIPKYVQKIGIGVLGNCYRIETLDVDPENEYLYIPTGSNAVIRKSDKTLVLGCTYTNLPENSVTTIGAYTFAYQGRYNKSLIPGIDDYYYMTSITIPEGVKTIKRNAFETSFFKNIIMPEGLETIESRAFENQQKVSKITIPSTVTAIGDSVFIFSDSLRVIVSKIKDPSQVKYAESLFDKTEFYRVLYVPKGSLAAYESSPYWGYRHFGKIVEGEPEDENSGTSISAIVSPQANKDVYYNLQGQRVETPTKGLYIKNGRKIFIK